MKGLPAQRGDYLALAAIAAALAALVVAANVYLVSVSALANVDQLRADLAGLSAEQAPPTWIEDWFWHQGAPYKYRILGKLPVWAVYDLQRTLGADQEAAFYRSFVMCCFASLFLALAMLGAFTRRVVMDVFEPLAWRWRLILECAAMGLLAFSAPVLLFAKFAVHGSPNDFIGYFLMLAVLHLAWVKRLRASCAVAVVAVFCRETTLLVPFALLFFSHIPFRARLGLVLAPAGVLPAFRLLWPGAYDPSTAAFDNLELPLQTLAFFFLVFGPLWILGLLGYRYIRRLDAASVPAPLRGLAASFPFTALLSCAVVFLFARLREIRILFVLFVYFVPFSIVWLYAYRTRLRALVANAYFPLWILFVIVASFRIRVWLLPASAEAHHRLEVLLGVMFTAYIEDPGFNWIVVSIAYLVPFLACLPFIALMWRAPPNPRSETPPEQRIPAGA